ASGHRAVHRGRCNHSGPTGRSRARRWAAHAPSCQDWQQLQYGERWRRRCPAPAHKDLHAHGCCSRAFRELQPFPWWNCPCYSGSRRGGAPKFPGDLLAEVTGRHCMSERANP
ncbi:unnamed protein product, partial [Symbiodinium sp. CCMP2592]